MFESLSTRIQETFKSLRGEVRLTPEHVEAALREIRLALLEADVNFKVVKAFIDRVRDQAMDQAVLKSLSPGQQVIKIVKEELVKILGSHESKLRFANDPPSAMLIVGLQGSGKTTSTGKLARWLSKNGHRPLLVSVDVYRPAAREQLKVVANAVKAHLYEGKVDEANTATVERHHHRVEPQLATADDLRQRTDRCLTPGAKRGDQRPLGRQRVARRSVVDGCDCVSDALVACADLNRDDPLTRRRHAGLLRHGERDSRREAQPR